MKREALENINTELFNSFNAQDENWIIGGGRTFSTSMAYTGANNGDTALEGDIDASIEPCEQQNVD